MQQHIANCLHTIGTMLMRCVGIATVDTGNGLLKKAIKKDLYEYSYHSKDRRGTNIKYMYRVCNEIL